MTIEANLALTRERFTLEAALRLEGHAVTAVFGPSGCGKTTLLRCLAGLEPEVRGHVRVAGEVWQDSDAGHFVAPHRRRIGFVFQHAALFPHLSVRGNLQFAQRRAGEGRLGFDEVVELTGLGALLASAPAELSGGERQRAALARALLGAPRLLLLDEPLSGLDAASKAELLPFLVRLQREWSLPVIYVTHSLPEVAHLASWVLRMSDGRVRGGETIDAFLAGVGKRAGGEDALALVQGVVGEIDNGYALAKVHFAGGELLVRRGRLRQGQDVRIAVHARDVSLSLHRPEQSSVLNVLPALIEDVEAAEEGQVQVSLRIGPTPLMALITQKSWDGLALRRGQEVFAQVKCVSLRD